MPNSIVTCSLFCPEVFKTWPLSVQLFWSSNLSWPKPCLRSSWSNHLGSRWGQYLILPQLCFGSRWGQYLILPQTVFRVTLRAEFDFAPTVFWVTLRAVLYFAPTGVWVTMRAVLYFAPTVFWVTLRAVLFLPQLCFGSRWGQCFFCTNCVLGHV